MAALAAFPLHSQRTRKLVRNISPSHSSLAFAVQLSLTPNCTPSMRPSLSERTRDRFIMLSCDNIFLAAENLIDKIYIYILVNYLGEFEIKIQNYLIVCFKIKKRDRPSSFCFICSLRLLLSLFLLNVFAVISSENKYHNFFIA